MVKRQVRNVRQHTVIVNTIKYSTVIYQWQSQSTDNKCSALQQSVKLTRYTACLLRTTTESTLHSGSLASLLKTSVRSGQSRDAGAAVYSLPSSSSLASASLLASLSFSSVSSSCESSCDSCWPLVCSSDSIAAEPAAAADTVGASGIICCGTGWSSGWGWTLCCCSRSCCSWGCWCISCCVCGNCDCGSCGGCFSSRCCGCATDGSQLYADPLGKFDDPAATGTSSKRGFLAPPDYTKHTTNIFT